jgi:hypothetical protein
MFLSVNRDLPNMCCNIQNVEKCSFVISKPQILLVPMRKLQKVSRFLGFGMFLGVEVPLSNSVSDQLPLK